MVIKYSPSQPQQQETLFIYEVEVDSYIEDFSIYAGSNPYGDDAQKEKFETQYGVFVTHNDGEWTLTFKEGGMAHEALSADNAQGFRFSLLDEDGKYLLGSMFDNASCHRLVGISSGNSISTTTENCVPEIREGRHELRLDGFNDRYSVREGRSLSIKGAVAGISYQDIHDLYHMTLKQVSGPTGGVTVTTSGYGADILGVPLTFDVSMDSYSDIPLDIELEALKAGGYEFSFVVEKISNDDKETYYEEEFTLTVNRRSSGGGGGGFARDREEEEAANNEVDEEEAAETVDELAKTIADLLERAANASDLTEEEQVEILTSLVALLTTLQSQVAGPSADFTFTRDLTVGSTGEDVRALQVFLNKNGYTVVPSGEETNYFGVLTESALARYQAANGISPAAGYFGPITRDHVNAL